MIHKSMPALGSLFCPSSSLLVSGLGLVTLGKPALVQLIGLLISRFVHGLPYSTDPSPQPPVGVRIHLHEV
jgi:hypothetical protein